MPDFDTPSTIDAKRKYTPRLQLVSSPDVGSALGSGTSRHGPQAEGSASLIWQIFVAFGPAGDAFHASERTRSSYAAQPSERADNEIAKPSPSSMRTRTHLWFRHRYQLWQRERRVRELIAYYKQLPDWALRDIGMERSQISYMVRHELSSDHLDLGGWHQESKC